MWNFHRELKWLGIALFLTVVFVHPAAASLNLEGRWWAGSCEVMATENGHAYFNAGSTLLIADLADPTIPVQVGKFHFPVTLTDIQVSGHYAYILLGEMGLKILDVLAPSSPVEVGGLEATNAAAQILVHGDTAYLIDGGLRVLDVSDPTSPTQIGFHEAWGTRATIADDLLLLVGGSVGLLIFDITDPEAPQPVGTLQFPSNTPLQEIVVKDHRAYACAGGTFLLGIDISDPTQPTVFISDHRSVYHWAQRLALVDGDLWVVGSTGLTVFEIHSPNIMPLIDESFVPLREGTAIATDGELGFISEYEYGLGVFEPTATGAPARVGGCDTRGIVRDVSIFNSYACLAMGNRGLHIVDFSNPGNMIEVSSLISMNAGVVHVSDQYAYVLGGALRIIDISDPTNPVLMGQTTSTTAEYIWIQGGFAYMSGSSHSLSIADVSDPANPEIIHQGPYGYKTLFSGMALVNDHTFVVFTPWSHYPGVNVTDVSNPSAPSHSASLFNTWASGMTARGDDLFLVNEGLTVMDASVPTVPVDLGRLDIDGASGDLALGSDTAYIASGGVLAIDISDYSSMAIKDHFRTGKGPASLAVDEDMVMLTNTHEGLLVFRDQDSDLQEITVDVKPGNDLNRVNCKAGNGVVPVAVLSTAEFDALTIDHTTVRFGPDEASETHFNHHGMKRHEKDVDHDGDLDLLFHFRLAESGIQCGDAVVTLTGETFSGQQITGEDFIQTLPFGVRIPTFGKSIRITPNPFNPLTKVSFYVDQAGLVRVSVYDIRGRRIIELTNQQYQAGEHAVEWQGRDSGGRAMPSGNYFFRVEVGGQVETRKAMLVR